MRVGRAGPTAKLGQGVVLAVGGLKRDEHYVVSSYAPSPTPAELVREPATYPTALVEPCIKAGTSEITAVALMRCHSMPSSCTN